MGYSSKKNRRPFEGASKASHHHIINASEVQELMKRIHKPPHAQDISLTEITVEFEPPDSNQVEAIIAVDGGYTEVLVDKGFPSSTIHFLQFGTLLFKQEDLERLNSTDFIAPEDMAKLKNISRLKLALPTKNIQLKDETTFQGSVLKAIYEFCLNNNLEEENSLIDTLSWFIFRKYKYRNKCADDKKWYLSSNPLSIENNSIVLEEQKMGKDYTFTCPETGKAIYLTDIFQLHKIIDEELGATGILPYLVNAIEHLIIIHIIRHLYNKRPELLKKIFFIKDGSTGFFGHTARLREPMLDLINWLWDKHNFLLAGLEKSGAFVDHAQEIEKILDPGKVLILNDDYIYRYILPGTADLNLCYGHKVNYGHKVIFKSRSGQMYVVSVPTRSLHKQPISENLPNLQMILANVESLHCDMYDSALFPVALVNKLVSLSAHPSQRILSKFARSY
ncbi:DNA double-strand break repair nuclease NurA [Oscillatoria sp. FACHB-1406]|uniref:DNA double-strand break repair nuclease NurA n=1 Tax=Oscillatoria sp. FACHB-1406 TaxID=2692846 RepID=UPI001687AB5F|nr:DNA double-strand break repair nuclease NurA [Oscillatoria sp. FACHB-1406]MBD2577682.1 DNA double-strand break repair nuclease NurA [Oscillatoria sp. FACHB-1406]